MKNKINKMLKKLLLIIVIFKFIISKSILTAKGITHPKCEYELGRYSFNITSILNGVLTQSMLDNYTINNSNNLKIICKFPEILIPQVNKYIDISCYTDNILYNNISFNFIGKNNDLEFINFNHTILHIENICCNKSIKLILGDIKEQKCKQFSSHYYYEYILEILNDSIPTNIELHNIDLKPQNIDENIYNTSCDLVSNNNKYYFKCVLLSQKEIVNSFFYEKEYIYKKEINNTIIYIQNLKNELYIGKNIKCKHKEKIYNITSKYNIKDTSLIKLRAIQDTGTTITDSFSEPTDFSDSTFETVSDSGSNNIEPNKTCNPNCEDCDNGNCKKCKSGFFKAGNDNCVKCLSTCLECVAYDNCTRCKDNFLLNGKSCVSCFDVIEGCEKCSQNICTKCYTKLNYKLNNNKCDIPNESNNINKNVNLKFERFDNYEKVDNKVYFKSHFILLNNYLSKTKLNIIANIEYKRNRNILLRYLEEKNIACEQYGNSFGNNNEGGYLANYECSLDLGENNELLSIEPIKIEIKDNNNNLIKDFVIEKILDVTKLEGTTSLDEEYKDKNFNKITISEILNIKLKDELSFDIIGDSDISIDNENTYDILLKSKDNKEIDATCTIPVSEINKITMSCISPKNEINEKNDTLTIEEGMYTSMINNDAIILNNKDNININIKKKSLSVGAIIGITIAGIVVVVPFVFYLVRFFIKRKDINNENNDDNEQNRISPPNVDNSRDIIFNHNS